MVNTLRIDFDTSRRWQAFLVLHEKVDEVEVVSKLLNTYMNTIEFEDDVADNTYLQERYIRCSDCEDE